MSLNDYVDRLIAVPFGTQPDNMSFALLNVA